MQVNNNGNNGILSPRLTTTFLLAIILLFLFNFNFDIFRAGAAVGPIVGQGNVGYIVKFVDSLPSPSASNTTVTVTNSNYCTAGVHATVQAVYTDPSATNANGYEVLIDDDLAADPNVAIVDPEWQQAYTTGISIPSGNPFFAATPNCSVESVSNPDNIPQNNCQMIWNTFYTAWARVRNSGNIWSAWTRMGTYINGSNPAVSVDNWRTPIHQYPDPRKATSPNDQPPCNPPAGNDFTWNPCNPAAGVPTQFTDRTFFALGSFSRQWTWLVSPAATIDTTTPPATPQNPIITFPVLGSYLVTLRVADDASTPNGGYCEIIKTVGPQRAIPRWREVAPR